MTDWDLITGYVDDAMRAVDKAHTATEDLRSDATPEHFDAFRNQMRQLTEELIRLQTVLGNEEAFAVDELSRWLSHTFTGHRAGFRATPRMQREMGC